MINIPGFTKEEVEKSGIRRVYQRLINYILISSPGRKMVDEKEYMKFMVDIKGLEEEVMKEVK